MRHARKNRYIWTYFCLEDVAISCPFGGEDQKGLVYIFNGVSDGLRAEPSQVIEGQWAAGAVPPSFGFSLRGAKDLDMNGYPGKSKVTGE